jgi:hypothetical protein
MALLSFAGLATRAGLTAPANRYTFSPFSPVNPVLPIAEHEKAGTPQAFQKSEWQLVFRQVKAAS